VSGAIAERTRLFAYAIYVTWMTAISYPFILRWVWNPDGFLHLMGVHDFAGSGVVHLQGGTAALMGCLFVGPRLGRFEKDGTANEIRAHSMSLYFLGSMLLWFGWFFFNGVSSGGLSAGGAAQSGRAMVNTAIGGSAGGVAAFLLYYAIHRVQRLDVLLSGMLAGCVGITANCDCIYAWAAWVIGSIAGMIYVMASKLIVKLKIDDVCDAVSVHLFPGAWGVFATAFFQSQYRAYPGISYGVFYGGPGEYVGVQLLACVIEFGWTALLVGLCFFLLRLTGLLRVTEAEELAGLDVTSHGGSAYSSSQVKPTVPTVDPTMAFGMSTVPAAAHEMKSAAFATNGNNNDGSSEDRDGSRRSARDGHRRSTKRGHHRSSSRQRM